MGKHRSIDKNEILPGVLLPILRMGCIIHNKAASQKFATCKISRIFSFK
jgi:hypothetical protein